MTKTFTENDLVRFLYGELNQKQTYDLNQALLTNESLQEELNELETVVGKLDQLSYKPSEKSLQKILDFSRGHAMHTA